jgi:hypothetical protein
MAYPKIDSTACRESDSNVTPLVADIPAGQVDDLIIINIVVGFNVCQVTTPSGWTRVVNHAWNGDTWRYVFAKKADSADATTQNFTPEFAARYTAQTLRISSWHGTVAEGMSAAVSADNSLNAPNLTSGWGAADTLWLTVLMGLRSDWSVTAVPSSYTSEATCANASSSVESRSKIVTAKRELNAASESGGSFTVSGTINYYNTVRLAIRPGTAGGGGLAFTVAPTVTSRTTNSYTIGGTLSESGDVFAVAILPEATDPTTPAQIIAGTDGSGTAARGTGQQLGVTNFSFNITGTNLSNNPTHDIFVVGRKET